MKQLAILLSGCLLAICALAAPVRAAEKASSDADPLYETEAQRDARMAWWRDARFGLFLHWGIFAVPAGEWQGMGDRDLGAEWIMWTAKIPVKRYELLARQFNPVKFNAQQWVRMAKDTGMKYVVITAKHADGFAMYRSKVSRYNVVDATPFARDPIAELAEACRKEGLRFGIYYSHWWDWHEPDATGLDNNWDFPETAKKNADKYLREKSLPQVAELLKNYQPSILWFDVPHGMTRSQSEDFLRLIRKLQPGCIVNDRVGTGMGDYRTPELHIPAKASDRGFETCMTFNEHWGYDKKDRQWKQPAALIRNLVDIASKNGNYLLNVGPTGEGEFPPDCVRILGEIGRWMKVNGESIHGTAASPFPALPWGRCTAKADKLYLHVFDWPKNGQLLVPGIENRIHSAHLLADPAKKPLKVASAGGRDAIVELPAAAPDPIVSVVVLELEGAPRVDRTVLLFPQPGQSTVLGAAIAKIRGRSAAYYDRSYENRDHDRIGSWVIPEDSVGWDLRAAAPGKFDLEISYGAAPACGENEYTVSVGQEQFTAKVQVTKGYTDFKKFRLGTVNIPAPGTYTVSVKPKTMVWGPGLMDLNAVVLTAEGQN